MCICIEDVSLASPLKVLREQSKFSLLEMANAIYVKPETLEALEVDNWEMVSIGAPLVMELLARVANVLVAKIENPEANPEF